MVISEENGSNLASRYCVRCHSPTINRCTGCLGAPAYNNCIPKPTFYCSLECQKADWRQHKLECRKLQARKTLERAALLLQAIIYRIRIHASPLHFQSARREGSVIYLEGGQPFAFGAQQLHSMPVCFEGDQSSHEAVSVYNGCMEAMVYLYSFAGYLFDGKPTTP
jgi:hypothetical protein